MVNSVKIWPTRTRDDREVQAFRRGQNDDNFLKANKVVGGVENNIVILAADGDIKDSGKSFNDVVLRDSNIAYADSDYEIQINDEIIFIICTTAIITVTLPANAGSRTYKIVKADDTSFIGRIVGQPGELISKETVLNLYLPSESWEPTKVNRTITGSDWLI